MDCLNFFKYPNVIEIDVLLVVTYWQIEEVAGQGRIRI